MVGTLLYVTEVAPYREGHSAKAAGVHHGLGSSIVAMRQLAELVGLSFAHTDDVRSLPEETLAGTWVLALFTIGDTPWSPVQRETIEARQQAGELGVLGLHSATDAAGSWQGYAALLGARFNGHPVTTTLPVGVVRRDHPATAHLPGVWRVNDELYLFRELDPAAEILLAIRMGPRTDYPAPADLTAADLPVAWSLRRGAGRTFYTALGHFAAAWEDVDYLRHVHGGLEWLLSG